MLSLKCTTYTYLRYEQYILKIWLVLQNWNVFPTVPSCITVVKNKYPPNMPFKLCSSPLHHSNLPLKNKKAQGTGCTPLATKHEFFPLDIALGVHVLCIHVIWLSFRESNALICYPLCWLPSYTTNSQFVATFTHSKNCQRVRERKAETYQDLRGCVERRRLQTGRVKAHLKVRVNLSRKRLPWGTYGEGRKKMRDIPELAIKGCVKLLALGFDLYMRAPTHAHTYTPCLQRQRALFYSKRSSLLPDFWKQRLGGVQIRVTTTNGNITTKFVTKLQLPLSCSCSVKLRRLKESQAHTVLPKASSVQRFLEERRIVCGSRS